MHNYITRGPFKRLLGFVVDPGTSNVTDIQTIASREG